MMRDRSSWRRLRRIFRRDPVDEFDEELGFHLEQRVRDYVARGMEPEAARRAALERLGDVDRVRDECTGILAAERRIHERRLWLNVSWLDVKLGVRMVAKYPGLSIVAVLGMAVAIAIGAGFFGFIHAMMDPTLPLDEDDRVVSIQNNRADNPGNPDRRSLHDFLVWRDELRSVRDLTAFRAESRNLVHADGSTELIRIAEMTASGFRVARVAPVRGRPLIDADDRAGAPSVVVIAYEEWQRRFEGDPAILGRSIRIGSAVHTVVGVMPEGFRFPINHRFWVPLRLNPSDYERGGGPAINIFGRLADGVTLVQAQAELAAIGHRMAVAYPDTHEHLRPRVLRYTHAFLDIDSPAIALGFRLIQLVASLLLVVVAVNVAILVYARTASRTGEIAVRTALGASRRRVVAQLFVEALVLSLMAAALGLMIAGESIAKLSDFFHTAYGDELPFWLDLRLSPAVVVYVLCLAIAAGVIVGVLPALKATGRHVQAGLQQLSSRGSSMQLGRTWTYLIVVQVALAVATLPAAFNYAERSLELGTRNPASAANELLRATLMMSREDTPAASDSVASERVFNARFADRTTELMQRLEAQPETSGVTFASHFPGIEPYATVEAEASRLPVEDVAGQQAATHFTVRPNRVDITLFDVFDVPILAGRRFVPADARTGATAIIVSESFAQQIAGGGNVLGRRIRYAQRNGEGESPWFEIVGVVTDFADDFTTPNSFDRVIPRLYHAIAAGAAHPAILAVRVRDGSVHTFATRFRDIAASVDPTLTLEGLETVAGAWSHAQRAMWSLALGITAVTLSVLLLSAAGIYAMMSFTVARRRREIGIRAALGADPRRILSGIFARATVQLGTGVAVGLTLAIAAEWGSGGSVMGGQAHIILPIVASMIMMVGLLAALGPARRGLAVQPTEALREE